MISSGVMIPPPGVTRCRCSSGAETLAGGKLTVCPPMGPHREGGGASTDLTFRQKAPEGISEAYAGGRKPFLSAVGRVRRASGSPARGGRPPFGPTDRPSTGGSGGGGAGHSTPCSADRG